MHQNHRGYSMPVWTSENCFKSLSSTCSESHPETYNSNILLRDSFTVSNANRTPKQSQYQIGKAFVYTHPMLGDAAGTKGTRCVLLLPHCRSWGSGRWMSTCTAKTRHNPPTIQKYIPNNVQRNDPSSSKGGVMGGSLDWFLLSVCSELLLDVGNEHGRTACSRGLK
jgi:hypothetical protein